MVADHNRSDRCSYPLRSEREEKIAHEVCDTSRDMGCKEVARLKIVDSHHGNIPAQLQATTNAPSMHTCFVQTIPSKPVIYVVVLSDAS
jgi:hypothetical protein